MAAAASPAGAGTAHTGLSPRLHCSLASVVLFCGALLLPAAAHAQFGIYDALARSFSDVSFSAGAGGLARTSPGIAAGRLASFGIEVLLEVGSVSRPVGDVPVRRDTVALRWTGMQVVRSATGVDTINTYEVVRVAAVQPTMPVWTFEVGVGYAQTTGYRAATAGWELTGGIRDLPMISLYASYVPAGTYFGVRSGFMRFHGLQMFDAAGVAYQGDAESFSAGAALGQVLTMLNLDFFAEASYTVRSFPSVRWTPGPVPPALPRSITADSWIVSGGIQFSMGRR